MKRVTICVDSNAEGNRVTTSSGGTVDQTETWDINNSVPKLATLQGAGGALEGDYHYDPLGTIGSEHTGAGAFYDYTDSLGSVTNLVSSTGADQETFNYDAFGSQGATPIVGTAPLQPFGFTGALQDQTIPGQMDLNVRSYSPATGTFTTRDPQAPENTDPYVASYVYGQDAPTYMTDPSGRSPGSWLGSEWDQFSSGFVQGSEAPFKLVANLYDAFTGQNGGWGGFFDTYVPARPAYRLYTIADMLNAQGCTQLADLYENAGNELAAQIAALGVGSLSGWMLAAAEDDSSGAGAGGDWPTIGETPGGAIGQTTGISCINACGEMLNELLTQESTLGKIYDKSGWEYSGPGGLAAELAKLDPNAGWTSVGIDKFAPGKETAAINYLSKDGPFAAQLKAGPGAHSVVIDGVDAAGNVVIRGPWDGGSTYTMTPQDFNNAFTGQVVFRR